MIVITIHMFYLYIYQLIFQFQNNHTIIGITVKNILYDSNVFLRGSKFLKTFHIITLHCCT